MQKYFRRLRDIAAYKIRFAESYGAPLALLATRIYLGLVFWRSGMTKITNLESTKTLFEYEYIPLWQENSTKNILGFEITFPVPDAGFAALSATGAELVFGALLILGLGARAAALGLFMMALTIESFIYPNTVEHHYWMLLTGLVMALGGGKLSADYGIRKKLLPDTLPNTCNATTGTATT